MSIASSKSAAKPDQVHITTTQSGSVDMTTEIPPLAAYLYKHHEWVQHCFRPLKVEPLSEDTYRLQFFRIGGLGFELEPCFGVQIGSESDRLFYLHSIELPSDADLPYHVDCVSHFRLEEIETGTRVNWDLNLNIHLKLPGFLQVLPYAKVKGVGEAVVKRVAQSMCARLTRNVCNDYYAYIKQQSAGAA